MNQNVMNNDFLLGILKKSKKKKKAIEENIEKAKKSGNVLTQTLNEEGDLVGVSQTVDFEEREVASADMHKEIMEEMFAKANGV